MDTSAILDGSHYVINGEKTWISNGGIADVYTLFARSEETPDARGISAFIIPSDTPGLEIAERLDVIAPHPLARLKFTDMRVPASAMIGAPGEGFKIAMSVLDVFRSTVGAAALGFARRALDETVKRASERELFGAPLDGTSNGARPHCRHGTGCGCSSAAYLPGGLDQRYGRTTCYPRGGDGKAVCHPTAPRKS